MGKGSKSTTRFDRPRVLELFDLRQRVVALVVLVLEAFLLAVLARSNTVEWYVVLLGITPLIVIIIGVFFGPGARPKVTAPGKTDIGRKIEILKGRLAKREFQPDLIVGLSRGGLVAAARLSHEFGATPAIPIISLWPHGPNLDNPLNSFDLEKIYEMQSLSFKKGHTWNVLIIDDACRSGRTLDLAKRHVEQKLSEIRSCVRTAALEIEIGGYSMPVDPDFYASQEEVPEDAFGDPEKR
jgi:hypoxanthine phosphoribosyltransferase